MFTLALVWKFYASPWSVLDVRIAIFFVGQQKRTDLISPRLDFTWSNPGTRCCPSLIENGILSFEREKIQTHVAALYFLKKEATHLYGEQLTNIIVTNSKGKRWDLTWSNPGTHCCLSRTPATHISYISHILMFHGKYLSLTAGREVFHVGHVCQLDVVTRHWRTDLGCLSLLFSLFHHVFWVTWAGSNYNHLSSQ